MPKGVVIMGAAGRDFHNFNTYFRGNAGYHVVAFTATQIPDIEGRIYPAEFAGPGYPDGIPIRPEVELPALLDAGGVDEVVFSYSDIPHEYVMHKASLVLSRGPDFRMLGPEATMLKSTRPVVSVTAVRTGVGKSQTTRKVREILTGMGYRVVVVRHPMPYGDLMKQACQRFATFEDMDRFECTVEEREEYEPHIENGTVVYAGVDYERILRAAEDEADVVLWDGGNNDFPFYRPDLSIVLVDPHRPGHETRYHPGETNLRMADVVIIAKIETATPEGIESVRESVRRLNPDATVIEAASPIFVDDPRSIRGKRVLVIEDGPTLTHGEMSYGAGVVAARKFGAASLVDPRPFAVGSIRKAYETYPHLGTLLPAMGYGERQIKELEATINAADADLVLIATPIDLARVAGIQKPALRVKYELQEIGLPTLRQVLEEFDRGVVRTRLGFTGPAVGAGREAGPRPEARPH